MAEMKRIDGRSHDELRPVHVEHNPFGYAAGSILFSIGSTKVLCSVTLQPHVPPFMKGKKVGWLHAEYAMLPTATKHRTQRASSMQKQQGRSVEISRLIGRVFRSVVSLEDFGERTIIIDCDVLQADGGTRTAAITGASIALHAAQKRWLANGTITQPFLHDEIAAVSVGVSSQELLLDLNFSEDSSIDADFNFVLTKTKKILEIQGTAEKEPLSWHCFNGMAKLAQQATEQLFVMGTKEVSHTKGSQAKIPLFSLQNRLQSQSKV